MLSESLLSAIYDLVSGDEAFQRIGGVMAEELGYRYGMLVLNSPRGPIDVSINQPPLAMAGYYEHYHKLDPWARLAAQTQYGHIVKAPEGADKRFYETEFYVDFAKPIGMVDPVGVRLPLATGIELVMGLNQSSHSHLPTAEDGEKVVVLGRHLQRALQLQQHLRQAVQMQGSLLSALSRVAFGMAITTADGRIEVLNAAGEQAIATGCGLQSRHGFLIATDAAMNGPLRMMIRDASNGGAGGTLRIRCGGDSFTNTLVAPLPAQAGWRQSGSRTLVAFRHAGAPSQISAQLLMSAFRLSRGEAQVSMALLEGKSVEDIALARGVKLSTVKTQLQGVFAKTGTSSQRELIRHVLSLPAIVLG